MNALRWPAPAPCARISVPAVSDSLSTSTRCLTPSYTSAVVAAPGCGRMASSLGFFKKCLHLGIRLQRVGHRQRAELCGERSREHPVHVALHDAGERHAPMLHDDM